MNNPNADRVKRVAQLAGRSAVRNRRKEFLVEGPQSVGEALRAHLGILDLSVEAARFWPRRNTLSEIYYTPRLASSDPELFELVGRLDRHVFVAETSDHVLQAMSDAVVHQNIIAVAKLPTIEIMLPNEASLVAGLVRVQDPGNAGTILRTADAAGASYAIATPNTVDLYNPKTVRSTAGSLFHLPIYTNVELSAFKTAYRGEILAADGYGDVTLEKLSSEVLSKPTAWLFGNEARGLSAEEVEFADARVAVPIYGLAESLNVATAATVCLFASALSQHEV